MTVSGGGPPWPEEAEHRPDGNSAGSAAIVRASWWATALFTVTAVAAVALDGAADTVAFVVAVGLFVAGLIVFVWSYVVAAGRSRENVLSIAGLYFLAGGSAPGSIRRHLLGSLIAQVVVSFATAIAKPYTSLAAGTLVPMYGLALCGLWAARYGTFAPRQAPKRRAKPPPNPKPKPKPPPKPKPKPKPKG